MNNKHTLTFTGELPSDEMERSALFGANPDINRARVELQEAFAAAGYPHVAVSHVVRPRKDSGKPRAKKASKSE
jgi:hypothetical protein